MPFESMFGQGWPEQAAPKIVNIVPKDVEAADFAAIKPHYQTDERLIKFIDALIKAGRVSIHPEEWKRLFRIEKLDGVRPSKFGSTEICPSYGEIADANYQEMERATVAKWYLALNVFFHSPEIQNFRLHSPDGRIKIAIPGCLLGFEIGAIVDFFNEQNLPVDIQAVDIDSAGEESQFMRLEERQKTVGSTVEFHSPVDAKEFFVGTKQDIVVFRNPGSVQGDADAKRWRAVFQEMMKTDPAMIIVSAFDYEIRGTAAKRTRERDGYRMLESDLFTKWLAEGGYTIPQNDFSQIKDDSLVYPFNPYFHPYTDTESHEEELTLPYDRNMFFAIKK